MTAPGPLSKGDPPPAHLDPNYRPPAGAAPAVGAPPPPPASTPAGAPPVPSPAPPTADGKFGQGSGVDLAPVAQGMSGVKEAARTGRLRMDEETAIELLKALADIRDRVEILTEQATELDVPLKLGDNWVGRTMSERLHAVARGSDSAAIRVLKQFRMVIDDYESTVQAATYRYATVDEEAQSEMRATAEKLGMTGVFKVPDDSSAEEWRP